MSFLLDQLADWGPPAPPPALSSGEEQRAESGDSGDEEASAHNLGMDISIHVPAVEDADEYEDLPVVDRILRRTKQTGNIYWYDVLYDDGTVDNVSYPPLPRFYSPQLHPLQVSINYLRVDLC